MQRLEGVLLEPAGKTISDTPNNSNMPF